MRKINWTYRVRNEEVVHRVKEERNILYKIKRRKTNCIVHTLRRNALLKPAIEGKIKEKYRGHEDKVEDVSTYWTTLREREVLGY